MKIYISGPITGEPDFIKHFSEAERKLKGKGYQVLNPIVWAKEGLKLEYDEYMTLDLAMLSICDAIYMLPGWANSKGAKTELNFAADKKIRIYYADQTVPRVYKIKK
mgnify:CR=1 FL=1